MQQFAKPSPLQHMKFNLYTRSELTGTAMGGTEPKALPDARERRAILVRASYCETMDSTASSERDDGVCIPDGSGNAVHIPGHKKPILLRRRHNLELCLKLNRFLPFFSASFHTTPLLPIGSSVILESWCNVASSPWFAMKRWPLRFSRPTTWPRDGVPSRLYSTV